MIERSLMTVDELKSMPKGHFIVMKTGCHPMKTRLKLFFRWGIQFENAYSVEEKSERKVQYADRTELEMAILSKYPQMAVPVNFVEEIDEAGFNKRAPKTQKIKCH